MSKEDTNALIFFSYASQDFDRVLRFYDDLIGRYPNIWLDKRKILGGQNWDFEIIRAIDKATIILAFISHNSVNKRGYIQKELRMALKKQEEKLPNDIFLIPILLNDDVELPRQLKGVHALSASDPNIIEQLYAAIDSQIAELSKKIENTQVEIGVRWSKIAVTESWDGAPGYDIKYDIVVLSSDDYSNIGDITVIIQGLLAGEAAKWRREKLRQNREYYHITDSKTLRTSIYEAAYEEPIVAGRALSIQYNAYWYGAGAAHGNTYAKTFVFLLDPLIVIDDVREVFGNSDGALPVLQEQVRGSLTAQLKERAGEELDEFTRSSMLTGTENWDDFQSFILTPAGIRFTFSPYHVAAYAFGSFNVMVEYRHIYRLLDRPFARALDLSDWQFERQIDPTS